MCPRGTHQGVFTPRPFFSIQFVPFFCVKHTKVVPMLHDIVKNGLTLVSILFTIAALFFSSAQTNASSTTQEAAAQNQQAPPQNLAVK